MTVPALVEQAAPRRLSPTPLAAIRRVMQLVVLTDLEHGVRRRCRIVCCHACERGREAPGFSRYEQDQRCHACATEFAVASAQRAVTAAGQGVREKRCGAGDRSRGVDEPCWVCSACRWGERLSARGEHE